MAIDNVRFGFHRFQDEGLLADLFPRLFGGLRGRVPNADDLLITDGDPLPAVLLRMLVSVIYQPCEMRCVHARVLGIFCGGRVECRSHFLNSRDSPLHPYLCAT